MVYIWSVDKFSAVLVHVAKKIVCLVNVVFMFTMAARHWEPWNPRSNTVRSECS